MEKVDLIKAKRPVLKWIAANNELIDRVKGTGPYTELFYINGKKEVVCHSLKRVHDQLIGFVKIYKGVLVRVEKLSDYKKEYSRSFRRKLNKNEKHDLCITGSSGV